MSRRSKPISDIKREIQSRLANSELNSRVTEAIEHLQSSDGAKNINKSQILNVLQQKGIIEDICSHFSADEKECTGKLQTKNAESLSSAPYEVKDIQEKGLERPDNDLYLSVYCGQGRAFINSLLQPDSETEASASLLVLHVQFMDKRFCSKAIPAVCEPMFDENFRFLLQKATHPKSSVYNYARELDHCEKIQLLLEQKNGSGEDTLLSSYFLEWRDVLSAPGSTLHLHIELQGVGMEHQIPVGILELRLKLSPSLKSIFQKDLVSAQISIEKIQAGERHHAFLSYSKLWWREYLEIRPEHKNRLVKIFAQDENGIVRPVISWISVLDPYPFLETPREAAWMVSLIPVQRNVLSLGSESIPSEQWSNPSTFLALKKGDIEDHAVLLCCLLLGFGLQAYMCLGTLRNGGPYAWVLTCSRKGLCTFWDPLTAIRYRQQEVQQGQVATFSLKQHPFKTVGCIFNNKYFFANCQPTCDVNLCSFDLQDSARWKAMSPNVVKNISTASRALLLSPRLHCLSASSQLQEEMCAMLIEHRKAHDLMTLWGKRFQQLLPMALATYELHGKTGCTGCDEEFLNACDDETPIGNTLKALPIHLLHKNPRKAFLQIIKTPLGRDIVECRGDEVRFALRTRIYEYVDGITSVWIMIAATYKLIL